MAKSKDFSERRIIRLAIKNIPKNYPDFTFQLNGYYRDYVRNGIYYNNLIEAALTVQDKGFKTEDYRNSQIQINQIRKNTAFKTDSFESRLLYGKNKKIPYSVLNDFNGNEFWILRIHDPIRNYKTFTFSFVEVMKSDFIHNHTFQLDGMVTNDNETFYNISFSKK
ncbi:MAG: hypothetical protein HC905_10350 [Bacteroidales bacterium]|nr:hypothetical protein [Bacteroidales bacterium]